MLKTLLRLYFLTFPLHIIGINISGYNFAIPSIISILIFITVFLFRRKLNLNLLLIVLLYVLWAFLTTASRFGFGTYLLSLGALFLMVFPVLIVYKPKELLGIDKYLYYGLILVAPFFLYDIGVTILNLPPLETISSYFEGSRSTVVLGLYRVKASFDEPSYFGVYLITLLYFFLNSSSLYRKKSIILILVYLLFTLSLTAYILAFIIFTLHSITSLRKLVLLYSVVTVLVLSTPVVGSFVIDRILLTVKSMTNSDYSGSEGSRGNSILVLFEYFSESDAESFFIGEGYGRYDIWLIEKFGSYNAAIVSYARGHINNAISVVGISNGFIGLCLYFLIFFYLAFYRLISKKALVIHILIQFSYAFIIGYMFWGIVLIFMIDKKVNPRKSNPNKVLSV